MLYIVDFYDGVTEEQIDEYLTNFGASVKKTWDHFQRVFLIESPVTLQRAEIVESIVENSDINIKPLTTEIEYNPHFLREDVTGVSSIEFSTASERDWWKNYILKDPELEADHKTIPRKGKDVTVYVMDSGINKDHSEFINSDVQDLFSMDGNFRDLNGHGTAIASVINGNTCGITDATVKSVKIFTPERATLVSDLLDALEAIASDADFSKWNIINCSWVVDYNQWINDKFQLLIDLGVILVVSAGNNGSSIGNVTPASIPDAFVIGSYGTDLVPSDFSNYTGDSVISYSEGETNYGALDAWAPGELIWAARPDGSYGYTAGTSMSAAIASAVFAYNVSDMVTRLGTKSAGYGDIHSPYHPLSGIVNAGNSGLLDLSDERYSNSSSAIITIYNRTAAIESQFSTATDQIKCVILLNRNNTSSYLGTRIINSYRTVNVEEVDPLPDGFSITSCGSLVWKYDEALVPSGEDVYTKITGSFRVTEIDGYEEVRNVTVFILKYDFDNSELPEDHEANIQLQFLCQGAYASECSLGTGGECIDQCGVVSCCAAIFKFGNCVCQG